MKWDEGRAQELGKRLLRYGLVLVFLYFGISQLLTPSDWTGWLPAWTASLPLSQEAFVLLNGGAEVVLGVLLLIGWQTRIAALLLGLHLLAITIDIGYTEIGVRDFGLTVATLAIALLGPDRWTIDRRKKK